MQNWWLLAFFIIFLATKNILILILITYLIQLLEKNTYMEIFFKQNNRPTLVGAIYYGNLVM
jgi:hypothetical protein